MGEGDFSVGVLVLIETVGKAVAGAAHVGMATLVVRGTEEENRVVRVLHADRTGCIFPVFVLQAFRAFPRNVMLFMTWQWVWTWSALQ